MLHQNAELGKGLVVPKCLHTISKSHIFGFRVLSSFVLSPSLLLETHMICELVRNGKLLFFWLGAWCVPGLRKLYRR